jgi:hypothetical protein
VSSTEDAIAYYRDLVRPVVEGRRFILIGGPVAGLTGLALHLRRLGADRPFILGTVVGTGAVPEPEEAEWRTLEVRGESIIDGIRRYESRLLDLPKEIVEAIGRYDPDREACVLGAILLSDIREVAGRRRYARPDPDWRALEDKVVIDAFWDELDVTRAPSRVVPAASSELRAAAHELDRGRGTVWAGDAREGINGGAVYLRWVRTQDDIVEAESFLTAHCSRVRVMPFLEGIPCSMHGVVLPDGVAVFRPVELVTLRPRRGNRLLYAGLATYWDPPSADREAMRSLARRVGEALRERVGFRGPFTLDGVLTEKGFLPTELNSRFGAGLGVIARSNPGLPLYPLLFAAIENEPFDFRARWLEEIVVEGADVRRGGGGWTAVSTRFSKTESHTLAWDQNRYRLTNPGDPIHGALISGPGDIGGFVRFDPDPMHVPIGPSIGPRVASALELADRALGTEIGPLEAALPVR